MRVTVDPTWSLKEAVLAARSEYVGFGITSRGYRNSVLKVWANMVGKKRALKEIHALIDTYGSKKRAGEVLEMAPTTFARFLHDIEALPGPTTRKPKIFLCHASQDKPRVRRLYGKLIRDGYDVWFDEDNLVAGQEWELEILKAIRGRDLVIVCLSQNAWEKTGYVQKEIRLALDMADYRPEGKGYIIPLKLEECPVPFRLQQWHWVEYFKSDGHERLIQALEANEVEVDEEAEDG